MKYTLMPYIYTQAVESSSNGWPMLRALLLEFPDDPGAWRVDDEYMFGSSILVAPMLEPGSSRDVYLPGKQKWIDFQTGKTYSPGWNHISTGEMPIVIMVKDGTALPVLPVAQSTDRLEWDKLTWRPFSADLPARGTAILPDGSTRTSDNQGK